MKKKNQPRKKRRFPEGVARFFNPEKSFKSIIPVYNAGGTYIRRIHNARSN